MGDEEATNQQQEPSDGEEPADEEEETPDTETMGGSGPIYKP